MKALTIVVAGLVIFCIAEVAHAVNPPPDNVFRVVAHSKKRGTLVSAGFLLDGRQGIITALHGVLGAQKIMIKSNDGRVISEHAKIEMISIAHDLVLINSDEIKSKLSGGFTRGAMPKADDALVAIGYPNAMQGNWQNSDLKVEASVMRAFSASVPGVLAGAAASRRSPALATQVLRIVGSLAPGYSGGPVLDKNGLLVGIANGGFTNGGGVAWAMPVDAIDHLTPYSETDAEVKRVADLSSELLFAAETTTLNDVVKKISRIAIGCKADALFESKSTADLNTTGAFSMVGLFHPRILNNRLGMGAAWYANRKYTSYNTFTTLKQYVGYTPVDYSLRRVKVLARYYLSGPFNSWRSFNAYTGASLNLISEVPLQRERKGVSESDLFIETRRPFHIWAPDYFVGVRFAKKWYTLELEAGYLRYKLSSQNFVFNFFGNATPVPQTDHVNNFNGSVALYLNLAMIQ